MIPKSWWNFLVFLALLLIAVVWFFFLGDDE